MMSKPGEFYLGVVSFFSVLLPGAVVTALVQPIQLFGKPELSVVLPTTDSLTGWITFLLCAYFLGQLVFALSSAQDPIYDALKERRIRAKNENAVENVHALDSARRIKEELLEPAEYDSSNVDQWALALLTALFASAAAEVQALEADSKFFRSLVPVWLLAAVISGTNGSWVEAGVSAVLAFVCFGRYYERRLKGTSQAYWYIIALHRTGRLLAPASTAANEDGE